MNAQTSIDWPVVQARSREDAEFRLHARFWNATVRFGIGQRKYKMRIKDGVVGTVERWPGGMAADLSISAPESDWDALLQPLPKPFYQDLHAASIHHGFEVGGDIGHYCAYYPAIRRLVEIMRETRRDAGASAGEREDAAAANAEALGAAEPSGDAEPQLDAAVGRYARIVVVDTAYRVYFETAGTGPVGLLLQHTAGADSRQWRHVLEDADLQSKFRIVAYDLPYHGKSLPPTSKAWWREEYRLTRDFLMAVPVALAKALQLRRPVYMGSSIGGHLAVDLALHHGQAFRAVVGLEASAYSPGGFVDEFHHPRIGNDFKAQLMYGMTAPASPQALRHETAWVYSQGAPAVFKGDLYYYSVDHDVRESAANIDTGVCSVDILNGEYDWSGTPAAGTALAAQIPGARYKTMPGLGHFPMCEHPAKFLAEIRPVLDRILAA